MESLDWITLIIFTSLFLLVLAKYFFKGMFSNFIILPFNNKYVALNSKKGKTLNGFHVLLTFFQIMNFSLFIFLGSTDTASRNKSAPILFLIILGSLVGYILLKIGIQRINAFVFDADTLVSGIIFNKLSYFNYSSGIAFIANIVLMYVLKDTNLVIYLGLLGILVINGIGLANAFRNYQKLISTNLFYFILYLCALEIAPIVIIGSYLND